MQGLRLGIDFGTSGARAIAIDAQGEIVAQSRVNDLDQTPQAWRSALESLLSDLPQTVRSQIVGIAINGTSSTVLLCDAAGTPLLEPLMYNDARAIEQLPKLQAIAPPAHTVQSATSSLAKLLWFSQQPEFEQSVYFLHQADWIASLLHGKLGISDYHNALKLGYDVEQLRYPDWMRTGLAAQLQTRLPDVRSPGATIGLVLPQWCDRFGLPASCGVYAGTTDSIAAFLASGAQEIGEAVTSLGSTLVIKLLSETRLEDARYGIYSHRLGNRWLVGGASNSGGAVLNAFFSPEQIQQFCLEIDPTISTPLDYYPLLKPGDRFPINDPQLKPRLEPRPASDREFLHGLLEGIARIEAQAYSLLHQLGASPLRQVYTAGGGAKNQVWTQIRSRWIGKPVSSAQYSEAAYGTARLVKLP